MRNAHCTRLLALAVFLAPVGAAASPGITKKGGDDPPKTNNPTATNKGPQDSSERRAAMAKLLEAEALVKSGDKEKLVEGMGKMLEAYPLLEASDGAESPGVIAVRSWLVTALELVDLHDEVKPLRDRGSVKSWELSEMPSGYFGQAQATPTPTPTKPKAPSGPQDTPERRAAMSKLLAAEALVKANDPDKLVDGMGKMLEAYQVLEQTDGANAPGVVELRSWLVTALELVDLHDQVKPLRERGRVVEWELSEMPSGYFRQPGSSQPSPTPSFPSKPDLKTDGPTTPIASSSSDDPQEDPDPQEGKKKRRRRGGGGNVEKGSIIPHVGIDLGLGSWRPETGDKGFMWTFGLDVRWTLFSANFFAMSLGADGLIGRNRDKRFLTDGGGSLGLGFNFEKFYLSLRGGGGYDALTGGTAMALRIAPNAYYSFGGLMGIRFSEKFGIYGKAMRLNRADTVLTNETRGRIGALLYPDKGAFDLAFVIHDFESSVTDGGAKMFTGNIGYSF